MIYCNKDFGEYIRAARECQKMSQYDLADIMNVSQPFISGIEAGEKKLELNFSIALCKAVGMDMRDFLNKYL
jgi:transcriptional regulator with XRE-family HTH domain